jgi:hypothetical protein
LDKLFGYFNIRDIEVRITLAPDTDVAALRKKAVGLSINSGIVSQFTALCVVDAVRPSRAAKTSVTFQEQTGGRQASLSRRQSWGKSAMDVRVAGNQRNPSTAQIWGASQGKQFEWAKPPARLRTEFDSGSDPEEPPMDGPEIDVSDSIFREPPRQRERGCSTNSPSSPRAALCAREDRGLPFCRRRTFPPPKAFVPNGLEFSVQEVIVLQAFAGYWKSSDFFPVQDVFWKNIVELKPVRKSQKFRRIMNTVYALALLETSAADRKVLWELCAGKGLEWLVEQSDTIDWVSVVARVVSLIE